MLFYSIKYFFVWGGLDIEKNNRKVVPHASWLSQCQRVCQQNQLKSSAGSAFDVW
jgi:hypothetical protein